MKYLVVFIFLLIGIAGYSQNPLDRVRGMGGGLRNSGQGGGDSLGRRNMNEDSITISYRYLDTARVYKMDSSVADFTSRYPIPAHHYYLGGTGNPTQSFLFSPMMKAGWDPGFHALDVYKFTIEKAKIFNVTRPYSELNYLIGASSEQYIEVLHTQNIKANWNASFNYRLINTPGIFNNQHASHNNYQLTNWYQAKNKRYNNIFLLVANKQQNSENGGIKNDQDYMNHPDYQDRRSIPTNIGGDALYQTNFFNTNIRIGNKYNDLNVLMRHSYDFGIKDSIVTDSTVVPLFYPKLRVEHTIRYSKYKYNYIDGSPDPTYYNANYDLGIASGDTVNVQDMWRELTNEFSIYQFPDSRNQQQYIKVGAAYQQLWGDFEQFSKKYYSSYVHGEYRNRTRNKRWDMIAAGKIYLVGINDGDYEASASLSGAFGKIGTIRLGVKNINKSPLFINHGVSSFYLQARDTSFSKENITNVFATIYQPLLKLTLTGNLFLMTNYMYYTDFYKINQHTSPFNVLQVGANKVFEFGKKNQWKWYADVYFQQVIGNGPVNIPAIFTRNRFGYEGNLGYRRLALSAGLEAKYRTGYKANFYSPILGQFYYQNQETVSLKMPDVAAYVHFRVNSLKAFLRFENLNSFTRQNESWGFYNNNLATQGYPYPGLLIRFGIFWGFVN